EGRVRDFSGQPGVPGAEAPRATEAGASGGIGHLLVEQRVERPKRGLPQTAADRTAGLAARVDQLEVGDELARRPVAGRGRLAHPVASFLLNHARLCSLPENENSYRGAQ